MNTELAIRDMLKLCNAELKNLKSIAKGSAKLARMDQKAVERKEAEIKKLKEKLT
jgi:hypothetical protein